MGVGPMLVVPMLVVPRLMMGVRVLGSVALVMSCHALSIGASATLTSI
jgi:hypothetical protein